MLVGVRKPRITDNAVRSHINNMRQETLDEMRLEATMADYGTQSARWLAAPPVLCVSDTVDPDAWISMAPSSPYLLPAHLMTNSLKLKITGIPEYAQFWRLVGLFGSLPIMRKTTGYKTTVMFPWALSGLVPVPYREHIENALDSLGVMLPPNLWDYDRIIPLDPRTRTKVPRWAPDGEDKPFTLLDAKGIRNAWPGIRERFVQAGLEPPPRVDFPFDDPVACRLLAEGYCASIDQKAAKAVKNSRTRAIEGAKSEDLASWAKLRTLYQQAAAGNMLLEEAQRLRSNYRGKRAWPLLTTLGVDTKMLRGLHGATAMAFLAEVLLCWISADMEEMQSGMELAVATTLNKIDEIEAQI